MAGMPAEQTAYHFTTLDNANDLTFNQLLGINNHGVIAGYFGSGAQDHPNKGYLLLPPYGQGNYVNENFPGSVQTQVTGLNDKGDTVGLLVVDEQRQHGQRQPRLLQAARPSFHTADFPTGNPATPPVDQLLGINNSDVAVGFYTDANGNNHGYKYNINTNTFQLGDRPERAGGQPDRRRDQQQRRHRRLLHQPRQRQHRRVPQDRRPVHRPGRTRAPSSTMALGVNDHDEVVGTYTIGTRQQRDDARLHLDAGRRLRHGRRPAAASGTTTINGVNDAGDLVGFYVDGNRQHRRVPRHTGDAQGHAEREPAPRCRRARSAIGNGVDPA